jgi:ketosteroid isomerase-like protein
MLAAAAVGALLAVLGAGCAPGPAAQATGARPPARPGGDLTASAADEARHADVAMAAAVAALDVEAFLGHVAVDGIFFGGRGPAAGRAAVGISWSPFFEPGGPRLAWGPDRAVASPSGDLVFTFGRATWTPPGGGPSEPGRYLTAWRRDADGLLRVALDGSDQPLPSLPAGVSYRSLRTLESGDGALLAEGGLLLDGAREVGWYLRLSRRDGAGFTPISEAGAFRPAPP